MINHEGEARAVFLRDYTLIIIVQLKEHRWGEGNVGERVVVGLQEQDCVCDVVVVGWIHHVLQVILGLFSCKNPICFVRNSLKWLSEELGDENLPIKGVWYGDKPKHRLLAVRPLFWAEFVAGDITLKVLGKKIIRKQRSIEVIELFHHILRQIESLLVGIQIWDDNFPIYILVCVILHLEIASSGPAIGALSQQDIISQVRLRVC